MCITNIWIWGVIILALGKQTSCHITVISPAFDTALKWTAWGGQQANHFRLLALRRHSQSTTGLEFASGDEQSTEVSLTFSTSPKLCIGLVILVSSTLAGFRTNRRTFPWIWLRSLGSKHGKQKTHLDQIRGGRDVKSSPSIGFLPVFLCEFWVPPRCCHLQTSSFEFNDFPTRSQVPFLRFSFNSTTPVLNRHKESLK